MKTIHTLALGPILTITAGLANAAPRGWDNGPRQPEHRYDSRAGYRTPPHRNHRQSIEVKAQLRLRQLGYYHGGIDGDFGRGSVRALVRFQRDHRLPVTARLDSRTLRSLRIL